MRRARNGVAVLVPVLAALCVAAGAAFAQPYPSKPIRFIVPFAPGGGADVIARAISDRLAQSLGQPVLVENKPGAGATVGADFVAKSAPDGYTLLYGTPGPQIINPYLMKKLPYDPAKRLRADLAAAWCVPNILVVHPSVPAKSVKELIELAKAKPGKINFGSAGIGATSHLSGELFKSAAGIEIVHVPYKGTGAALQDLLAGNIQMAIDSIPVYLPHLKSGSVRALAVSTPQRSPVAARAAADRRHAARLRCLRDELRQRARGHAAPDRGAAEPRDQRRAAAARGPRAAARHGRDADGQHARGARSRDQERVGEVEEGDRDLGRQGRIAAAAGMDQSAVRGPFAGRRRLESLDALFAPRSIAIVGASQDARKIGGRPLAFLKRYGYPGAIYPINPQYPEVQGMPAFSSLGACPAPPEQVVVALPAPKVPAVVARGGGDRREGGGRLQLGLRRGRRAEGRRCSRGSPR